jgi:hypothetical protein
VDAHPQANSSPTAAIVEMSILIMTILLELLSPDNVTGLDAL